MYVNRGMIEAAKTEGEVAGVLAHEMSHVALAARHRPGDQGDASTRSARSPARSSAPSSAARPAASSPRARSSASARRSCDSAANTRSRPTSRARRSWRAPDTTRATWRTCSRRSRQQGGSGGPQWLSDHPNPGDRYAYITKEAQSLHVAERAHDTDALPERAGAPAQMPPAPSTEEATEEWRPAAGSTGPAARGRSPATSSALVALHVLQRRQSVPHQRSVELARTAGQQLGHFRARGRLRHGEPAERVHARREVGLARNETHDLQTATDELLQSLAQSNPRLRQSAPATTAGRSAIAPGHARCSTTSRCDRAQRADRVFTTLMHDGTLFYLIGVAPDNEFNSYRTGVPQGRQLGQFAR